MDKISKAIAAAAGGAATGAIGIPGTAIWRCTPLRSAFRLCYFAQKNARLILMIEASVHQQLGTLIAEVKITARPSGDQKTNRTQAARPSIVAWM